MFLSAHHPIQEQTTAMPLLESFDSNASVEKCTLLQADVADKGRKAWTFLAAASAANFFTYGKCSIFMSLLIFMKKTL